MQLDTDIRYIKGIGEARARSLEKLGIRDLAGLVSYFPRAYEDRSSFKPIAALEDGESVCVRAMVAEEPQLVRIRGGMEMVKLRAVDETGTLFINFFNRAYVRSQLHRGQSLVFFGRVSVQNGLRSMANPLFEPEGASNATGRIMPVYRLTAGLSQKVLIHCVRSALTACAGCLPDYLPGDTALDHGLCTARYAYENIHFPKDFRALELARRRLVFEELFVLVCALGLLRGGRGKVRGAKLRRAELSDFTSTLPFTPTGAQPAGHRHGLPDEPPVAGRRRQRQDPRRRGLCLVCGPVRGAVGLHGPDGDTRRAALRHSLRLSRALRAESRKAHGLHARR